jgi:hypothetical protein
VCRWFPATILLFVSTVQMRQHAPAPGIVRCACTFPCICCSLGTGGSFCLGVIGTSSFLQLQERVLLPRVEIAVEDCVMLDGWTSSQRHQIVRMTGVYDCNSSYVQGDGVPSSRCGCLFPTSSFSREQRVPLSPAGTFCLALSV